MKHDQRTPTISTALVNLLTVREHLDEALGFMFGEMKGQMKAKALSGQPGRGAGATIEVTDDDGKDWVPVTGVEAAAIDGAIHGDEAAAALARLDDYLETASRALKGAAGVVRAWQRHDLSDSAASFLKQQAKGGDAICEMCQAQGWAELAFTKEPSDVKGNLTVPLLLCEWDWRHVNTNGCVATRKQRQVVIDAREARRATNGVGAGDHA